MHRKSFLAATFWQIILIVWFILTKPAQFDATLSIRLMRAAEGFFNLSDCVFWWFFNFTLPCDSQSLSLKSVVNIFFVSQSKLFGDSKRKQRGHGVIRCVEKDNWDTTGDWIMKETDVFMVNRRVSRSSVSLPERWQSLIRISCNKNPFR